MSKTAIHGKRRTLTASGILEAIGRDLSQIKAEDGLTYAEMGRVLGKSEDQAAKYCDGTAEIGIVSYTYARREWNGRFTGSLDALVYGAVPETNDHHKVSAIARAVYDLSLALEDDSIVTAGEVKVIRKSLEAAQDAITELLRRMAVRAA